MKKSLPILYVLFIFLTFDLHLLAGGIDNRSNFSGEYLRTLNRNAATDSLDAVAYNPAGVMTMEDGKHGNLSVHYVWKDYTNTVDGTALEQDRTSIVPALFTLIKDDKWAGFFSFTIPAGGGEVEYESGNATTRIGATGLINMLNVNAIEDGASGPVYGPIAYERLKAESFYHGFTAGVAYKLDDIFSFSLAGRYISANKSIRAEFQITPTELGTQDGYPETTAVLDYEDDATGFGFILGMNINYSKLNIGMRYEAETSLDFTYDVHEDSITGLPFGLGAFRMGIINAAEHSRNLPAVLAIGAGYNLTPDLKVDVNMTTYFQENADWEGDENEIDNGWEAGIAVEYKINPKLKVSGGYLYTETGMNAKNALKEAPELNATTFGAGLVYYMDYDIKLDLGVTVVDYEGASYVDTSSGTDMKIGLDKSVKMLSVGIEHRF